MFPFPHLTELGSSWTHVLLALGAGLILPSVVDPTNNRHRAALMGISFLLALRYVWWRGTETLAPAGWTIDMLASWSLFALEMLALIGSISAFTIMSRIRLRSEEADAHEGWWASRSPASPS